MAGVKDINQRDNWVRLWEGHFHDLRGCSSNIIGRQMTDGLKENLRRYKNIKSLYLCIFVTEQDGQKN